MPWNYTQVQSMYPSTGVGFLEQVGDRTNLRPPVLANAIKKIIATEGGLLDSPSVLERARASTKNEPPSKKPYLSPAFGHVTQRLSEVATPADLGDLLRHADTDLNPSWSNGGLYYARCDSGWDKTGNHTYIEPYTRNSAIGYAKLNVTDGQKKIWDSSWTAAERGTQAMDRRGAAGAECRLLAGQMGRRRAGYGGDLQDVEWGAGGHHDRSQKVTLWDLWSLCQW